MTGIRIITDKEGTKMLGNVMEYSKAYSECGLAGRAAVPSGLPLKCSGAARRCLALVMLE